MPIPAIDPLPQPPDPSSPLFNQLAFAFFAQLVVFGPQTNAVRDFINAAAVSASASAVSAINAPGSNATSATQLAIGAGAKTFAIQPGKNFVVGQFVTAAQTNAPGNYMGGQITAHDPNAGSLTVQVLVFAGVGQVSDWTIGLSSPMQFIAAAAQDIWAGIDSSRPITSAGLVAAGVVQPLADASTITPDFTAGANFIVTLGGSRTLANPSNAQPGDSGLIVVQQDATGGRSLAFGANWKFPGGAPALTATAGAIDAISYLVIGNGVILATLVRGFR